jgi:hypothetical protein
MFDLWQEKVLTSTSMIHTHILFWDRQIDRRELDISLLDQPAQPD